MSSHFPWFRFFPGDWLVHQGLSLCGLAARGVLADCLALAHTSEHPGHLVLGGRPMTPFQLAKLRGVGEQDIVSALAELEVNGVISRDSDGAIYFPRMVKDIESRQYECSKKQRQRAGNKEPVPPIVPDLSPACPGNVPPIVPDLSPALSQVCPPVESESDIKKNKQKKSAPPLVLPTSLESPEFKAAWSEWIAYRAERKLSMTTRTIKKQLELLEGLGTAKAIQTINNSIVAGYQGLFPPKESATQQKSRSATRPAVLTPAEIKRRNAKEAAGQ